MRVLVYEPKFVGHFLGFATWAANAFAKRGYPVVFAVPRQAEDTQQASVKLRKVDPSIDLQYVIDAPPKFDRWKVARLEAQSLLQDLDRIRPDYLVAPSADFLICGMLLNGKMRRAVNRLEGSDFILHSCAQTYPSLGPRDTMSKYVDRLCIDLARSVCLHAVDPFALLPTSGAMSIFGKRVLPIPHPFESPAPRDSGEARGRLGLPLDRRLFGTLGDLGVRKGVDLLIRSFCQLEDPDFSIYLCGTLSAEMRQLLADQQERIDRGQIIVRDEFVSDDVFDDSFYALDGIWAGYRRQIGIASMLLYAADTRRPVIASDEGSVGWMTREYGLGKPFKLELNAATEAMKWFDKNQNVAVDEAGAQRLMEHHTLENFERELTRDIARLEAPRVAVAS